jgi:thioredoxin reductase (NADPH)
MPDAASSVWDVIIVGAGPAGLAAALYAGRARRRTLVLEKKIPGGQILLTDWVENYPGFPDGVAPFDLTENFRRQAQKFGAAFATDEVKGLSRSERGWRLAGARHAYEAKAVIIATGSDYRRLGIPGESRLTGSGVSYCAICDGAFFGDRDVAVVGGGDNALKESLFLAKYARRVTLIHRRDKFRGEKVYQERVQAAANIMILWETVIEEVLGRDQVEGLRLRHLHDGSVETLPVAALFVSIGTEPLTGFVAGILELNEWGQVKVGPDMRTSQPGIYAAGDVSDACPKQLATAVGTGVHAALAVEDYLASEP